MHGFHFLKLLLFFCLFPVAANGAANNCLSCHDIHDDGMAACTSCHRGDSRSTRINVAHNNFIAGQYAFFTDNGSAAVKQGLELINTLGCRRCHITDGKGNDLAANLDFLFDNATPAALHAALDKPAYYMPAFRLADEQITRLINAVLYGGYHRGDSLPAEEIPVVVHFEKKAANEKDTFSKACGLCHKALTAGHGGLGEGIVAPNLSGLFSEFYPGLVDGRLRWDEKNLREWLKNPRDKRANTQMLPVALNEEERHSLMQVLGQSRKSIEATLTSAPLIADAAGKEYATQ